MTRTPADAFLEAATRVAGDDLDVDPAELAAAVERSRDRRLRRALRPHKRCTKCRADLPARAFAEDNSKADGLQKVCRDCQRSRSR